MQEARRKPARRLEEQQCSRYSLAEVGGYIAFGEISASSNNTASRIIKYIRILITFLSKGNTYLFRADSADDAGIRQAAQPVTNTLLAYVKNIIYCIGRSVGKYHYFLLLFVVSRCLCREILFLTFRRHLV